jgi:hypothetical protein
MRDKPATPATDEIRTVTRNIERFLSLLSGCLYGGNTGEHVMPERYASHLSAEANTSKSPDSIG